MVAYSFQARFAEPILAGTKGGTIRAVRALSPSKIAKRGLDVAAEDRPGGHARPGETLQLYTGMRTKHCRRICDKRCLEVEPIRLGLSFDQIELGLPVRQSIRSIPMLDAFARFDGFVDFYEMRNYFWEGESLFVGWHIRWLPLPGDTA